MYFVKKHEANFVIFISHQQIHEYENINKKGYKCHHFI